MINISRPTIGDDEKNAVMNVMDSGHITAGEEVCTFEKEFSEYLGSPYAIATSSGTSALHTMINSLKFNEGDEVITTPFTFVATVNAIKLCGLKPVFADVDEKTYNIDPESVEKILRSNNNIKGLLVVHLFGQACDMDRLVELCREYDILLMEDVAQAHGSMYKGKKLGTFGEVAAFSFYATKNMITGEGGMIVCNDNEINKRCRLFINHGSYSKYKYEGVGMNYRMTDVEAAIGRVQLRKLDAQNKKRRANANLYNIMLKSIKDIILPKESESNFHVYHQYVIRVMNGLRDELLDYLKRREIVCGVYYPKALHQYEPCWQTLINAENSAEEVLALPIHPELKEEEIVFVALQIVSFFNMKKVE